MEWSNVEIGLVALAAFIMAADEGLRRAPALGAAMPRLIGLARFVPLVLVSIAAVVFIAERTIGASPRSATPSQIAVAPLQPATVAPRVRMGPRTTLKVSARLASYIQEKSLQSGKEFPFAIIVSAPPENAEIGIFINELLQMAAFAKYVRILPAPGENDVGPLKLPPQNSPGIIVHGDTPLIDGIASALSECIIVSVNRICRRDCPISSKYRRRRSIFGCGSLSDRLGRKAQIAMNEDLRRRAYCGIRRLALR